MFKTRALRAQLLCIAAIGALSPQAYAQDAAHIVILGVVLNGAEVSNGEAFLEDNEGRLWVSALFLQRWNLRTSSARAQVADGVAYFDVRNLPGLQALRNTERAEVSLKADRNAFMPSTLDANALDTSPVLPYSPGGFVNYDLALSQTAAAATHDALLGMGLFAGSGLFTNTLALRDASSVRLLSSVQIDMQQTMKTLRLGDSVNTTGAWGLGVLYGGVQYGTNFAVRPDFIAQSMPGIAGDAVLPATVDVFVNNVLRSRQNVEAGPFSIQNLPLVNGQGELQVVVRDVLGREQVLTQAFVASPTVLREGLVQDAYELGALRRNYGLQSDDYGDTFGSATWRKGMTREWTTELRAEVQRQTRTVGFANAVLLPQWSSTLETTVAISRSGHGNSNSNDSAGASDGSMLSAIYSFTGRRLALNARTTLTSAGFRQLGSDPEDLPARQTTMQVATPVGTGTLIANYLFRQNQLAQALQVLTLSYSQRLSANVFAALTVLQTSATAGTAVMAGITVLLDRSHYSNTSVNHTPHSDRLYADYTQVADSGEGVGYRLSANQGDGADMQEATFTTNHAYGSWGGEVAGQNGTTSTRLWATGGVASLGNGVHFTRGIAASFAIVKAGDLAGVPVYLESQLVARTNEDGTALVNNLRAYQDNRISIDPLSLPPDSSMGALSQIVQPRLLGGIGLDFAVHRVIAMELVVQQNGKPLPAWTSVQVAGVAQGFVVGKRGEVFVELPAWGRYRVWATPPQGSACSFELEVGPGAPLSGVWQCQ